MADTFYGPGAAAVPLYQAVQRRDRARAGGAQGLQDGSAPPGWERSIKRMKKHGDIDNPWALAWWMKRRGHEPSLKDDEADAAFDRALEASLAINKGCALPREYTAAAKGEVWAQSLLLDPNLPPLVVEHR